MQSLKVKLGRENQCRFCLKPSRTRINITKVLKKKFLDVTQTELQATDRLSNFLCLKCSKSLKSAHLYRQKLIATQKELLKEIAHTFVPELINLKQEKVEDDEVIEEPEINVKEESKELEFDQNLFDTFDSFPFEDSIVFEEEVKTEAQDVKVFKCDFEDCGEEFTSKRPFNAHMKLHKPKVSKELKEPRERVKGVRKKERKDKKQICPICGVIRCHKWSLHKHIEAVHKKALNYFCDVCGYGTAIRCALKTHMKQHMDQSLRTKYICDKCEFTTICRETLRRHVNAEHNGFSIPCHCGKSFRHKASLQTHVNIVHLKIKNHECNTCGKKFYGKKDLKDHIYLAHTEQKEYVFSCDECGKQFYTRKQLMRHLPYHTESKYKCKEYGCDKAYITEKKLERHMKTHVGQRDHLCHLCEKAYFFAKDLQRHLDVAHKQTTYFCELCSFTNNRKDYLGNHIRSSHQHVSQEERNKMLARAKFVRNNV